MTTSIRFLSRLSFLAFWCLAGAFNAGATCTDADADGYFREVGCGSAQDCNDGTSLIRPGATETCNGLDDDCNGWIDDGAGCACGRIDDDCSICPSTQSSTPVQRSNGERPKLAWNGQRLGVLSIKHKRSYDEVPELHIQLLNPDGTLASYNLLATGPGGNWIFPSDLASNGASFAALYISYDNDTVFKDVKMVRVSKLGMPEGAPTILRAAVIANERPRAIGAVVWNGASWGAFWHDEIPSPGLWYREVRPDGVPVGPAQKISPLLPSADMGVAWTGSEYHVVWTTLTAPSGVYFARVDQLGALVQPAIRLEPGFLSSRGASVAWNGFESLAVWNAPTGAMMGRRITPHGVPLGTGPFSLGVGMYPRVAWNGAEYVVASCRSEGGSGAISDLTRVDATGAALGVSRVGGFGYYPEAAWTGTKWVVVKQTDRPLGPPTDIEIDYVFTAENCACSSADADGDGFSSCAGDCDDSRAAVYPGAPQLCDGRNNDCASGWSVIPANEVDADADGSLPCAGDCAPSDATVYPGAAQACDGRNNDCLDPNWPTIPPNETDTDGDSYRVCSGDCDDTQSSVRPGAPQVCDGVNNDCSSPSWPDLGGTNEGDDDGDGRSECSGDCDDARAAVYPGAPEICDGRNNDCSYPGWPSLVGTLEWDDDGDGRTECAGDCDDVRASVYPGAPQLCDRINNDCSDPAWPAVPVSEIDDDGDAYSECQGDCADSEPARHPGAQEVCNSLDDDCDTLVDEDAAGVDSDGDGVANLCDNCRDAANPGQLDADADRVGNACDNCITAPNASQADLDGDQRGDACDNCVDTFNPAQDDLDADAAGDACDNCLVDFNPSQGDVDGDSEGDVCDRNDGLIWQFTSDESYIEWQDETGPSSWNVYEGDLQVLKSTGVYTQAPGSNPLAERHCGVTELYVGDPGAPESGQVAFSLVTGMTGGVEGGLGTNSAGAVRPNANPCP